MILKTKPFTVGCGKLLSNEMRCGNHKLCTNCRIRQSANVMMKNKSGGQNDASEITR